MRFDRLSLFGVARTVLLLGVGLGLSAVALIAYGTNALESLELRTVDARFAIRGERSPPRDVAIVAIDSASLRQLGRWPIPRRKYAPVLERLKAGGARVIAIDIQFTTHSDERNDRALYDAVKRAGNVVLATTEVKVSGDSSLTDISTESGVLGGDRKLRAAGAVASFSGLLPDRDGRIRHFQTRASGLNAFAFAAAKRAAGRAVRASAIEVKRPIGSGPGNPLTGPSAWIDFAGPRGTIPATSFWRVAQGTVDPGIFRNRVVVLGVTAAALEPTDRTGVDDHMSDLELEANSLATALHGFPLEDSPAWLDVVLVLLLGMIPALASIWLRARWTLLAAGLALAGFLVAAQLAFDSGTVIPVLYPVAALVATSFGVVPARYVTDSFERTRGLFQRFVPESYARSLIAERQEPGGAGGGETLDATVMFADLRGFTSFAESLEPGEVIQVVNRYLQEMSDSILDHGGTVVSYMGDGIMAVFGAPDAQPDHADRALAAAVDMLGPRLAQFNGWLAAMREGVAFALGVGLNSGAVISGTVGSTRRLEYAAIGDTTNTAARLQAMTKDAGTSLLVARSTVDRLTREAHGLAPVGKLAVRGREGGIEAFTLASLDM